MTFTNVTPKRTIWRPSSRRGQERTSSTTFRRVLAGSPTPTRRSEVLVVPWLHPPARPSHLGRISIRALMLAYVVQEASLRPRAWGVAITTILVRASALPGTSSAPARLLFAEVSAFHMRAPFITRCPTPDGIYPITTSQTHSVALALPGTLEEPGPLSTVPRALVVSRFLQPERPVRQTIRTRRARLVV